jgi:dTDP-glucose 4,6-dehydratase
MKKILITGGNGFIAFNFIKMMLETDYDIVSIDNLSLSKYLNHEAINIKSNKFKFIQCDIRSDDLSELIKKHRFDVIINFAAESHVDKSIHSSNLFVDTNIRGTNNLLTCCNDLIKKGVLPNEFRFIQVSTDEVYGSLTQTEPAFTESSILKPTNPYSASKASADLVAMSYFKTHNFPVMITRCSNNFGPYQYPEKLIPLAINNIVNNKKIPIYGNGQQIRDWIYVEDHCSGIKKVLEQGCLGQVYNFGGYSELTNLEIIETIIKIMKPNETSNQYIEYVQDRPGHDTRYAINAEKALNELGWKPSHNFMNAIVETVNWYINNNEWSQNIMQTDQYKNWVEKQY